jgi:hypothetical protein
MMSSFRNFCISLVAALLILSAAAYNAIGIASTLFDEERNQGGNNQGGLDVEKYEDPNLNVTAPIKTGRSFNMIFIGIDDYTEDLPSYGSGEELTVPKRSKATTILFVRYDKENRSIIMSNIPASTVVTIDFVTMTLGEAFGYRGAEYVKEKASALTGLTIDFSFVFSGKEFAKYAVTKPLDKTYTVPFTVTTKATDTLPSKTFVKGQHISTEQEIYTLLQHDEYPISEIYLRYSLVQSFFLQTVKKLALPVTPETYYNTFLSDVNTNMTVSDLTVLMEVLTTLSINIDEPEHTTNIKVVDFYKQGSFLQDGRFTVDMASSRKAFENYKK